MLVIGWPELVFLLVVVLVIFGTSRLAGLGKASGRAIREFKEEVTSLKEPESTQQPTQAPPANNQPPIYDAEIVDPENPATN